MTSFKNMPDPKIADAPPKNWVSQYAPPKVLPFLQLSRIDRPIGAWLLLFPAWWGLLLAVMANGDANGRKAFSIALVLLFGAWLMRGAGCTWNDISDRHFDAHVARTKNRPLPSGRVSLSHAVFWMVVQALGAFALLLTLSDFAILLGILSLAPVLAYPFAKRYIWCPQLILGIAFNWGILLAWAAYANALHLAAFCLYFAGVLWTLIYDTIYAHQDKEDDALIGIKSTARLFGEKTSIFLIFCACFCVALMGIAVFLAFDGQPRGAMVWALIGVACFGGHIIWQFSRLDIAYPEICLSLFRSNRDAGLVVVLFWTIGAFFMRS